MENWCLLYKITKYEKNKNNLDWVITNKCDIQVWQCIQLDTYNYML